MSYFQSDKFLKQLNDVKGLSESIYETMSSDDIADLPIKCLEALKTIKELPFFPRELKSEITSNKHRESGNKAYSETKYRKALECYNKALLYAPKGSKSMLLAYSNRSALFHQNKCYSASLADIETCFKNFDCEDIEQKLKLRKQDCLKKVDSENIEYNKYAKDFFNFDVKRNPDIPCASTDVEVQFDEKTNVPKVVAAADIDIGTVLAIEPVFACIMNPENHYFSCYYCYKMSQNLIPCPNCCHALYCNKKCKKRDSEMHRYECHLMEVIHSQVFGPYSRITIRTVLKICTLCSTWKEFNDASKCVGTERLERSTVKEIYDVNEKFSMLSFLNLRDTKPGSMYQFGFNCGTLLYSLTKIPLFLCCGPDENIKGLARMLMKVYLQFSSKIEINSTANDWINRISHTAPNYGYFSFASKLNHACDANVLPVGLNDKLGLIALQPIKKGAELTISYVDHAYDHMHEPSNSRLGRIVELSRFFRFCHCAVCEGMWKFNHRKLTVDQKKVFKKWCSSVNETHILQLNSSKDLIQDAFKSTCNGLTVLQGMSHRPEHREMYVKFRNLMCVFQLMVTRNCLPEDIGNFKLMSYRI